MSFTPIKGTPLELSLFFVPVDAPDKNPADHPHPLGSQSSHTILEDLLALLSPAQAAALSTALSTPLDQVFQKTWSDPTTKAQAKSLVEQAVRGAKPNAYAIDVTIPARGTLRAEVGLISPGLLPPGTPGQQLRLSFSLPGFSVSFSESTNSVWGAWADPSYNLTFDGEIAIDIAVATDPRTPFGVAADFLTHNMQAGPDNGFAVLIGIEDLISAWWNDEPFGPGSSLQDQQVPIGNSIPALLSQINELSQGFALAFNFGFTVLGVQINMSPPPDAPPGPTVEFDLTLPFLPGPVVRNALVSSVPSLFSAEISTSSPQVKPGGVLAVLGAYFPAAQPNSLTITWTDTVIGGALAASDIQYVASATAPANGSDALPQGGQSATVNRTGPSDGKNMATLSALLAGTSYAVRVRDRQLPIELVSTDWGPWTDPPLLTAVSNEVVLVLEGAAVGAGMIQSDGTLATMITVPASLAPGTYILYALLGIFKMAQTPIEVVAQLSPVLQILDGNGLAINGAASIVGPADVTLRGTNFTQGAVSFFVDNTSSIMLGGATADSSGAFTATITWPYGTTGAHTILASQPNGTEATAPVYAEALPK